LISLEKKRVLNFLFLLSRADPPVISPVRKKQFFHDVGRAIGITPKPNKKAELRSAAFERNVAALIDANGHWRRIEVGREHASRLLSRSLNRRVFLIVGFALTRDAK